MRELIDRIAAYIQGMWRYRWYGLAVAWIVAGIGWAMALQVPNEYRSSAQVHVDTESMLKPLMRGLVVESNMDRRVELMTRTLFSRPNLEEIARQTDLDLRAETQQDIDRIVAELQRRLRLAGTSETNLYRITYQGDDPVLARDVVQAAVNLFVEESMRGARDDTDSATRFLDRKIAEYAERLDAADRARIAFRREHAAELTGAGGGDYYQRLTLRRAELEAARGELDLARSRESELERQLDGEAPVFGIMGAGSAAAGATPELDRRIEQLSDQLDDLLLRYTEEHPRVGTLRAQLERHEAERAAERERLAAQRAAQGGGEEPGLERNPVHQEIRSALARARAEVAAAQARVVRLSDYVEALEESAATVPEIEVRFEQLEREHQAIQATYEELQRRRQTAEISGEVERSEDQIEFRVIEPPRIPSEPSAPNRPLLVTASLGASGAGFGALMLLLVLVWPTFHSRATLGEALQLPVLGAVQQVPTRQVRRRRWLELTLFVFLAMGLLLAYAGVMGFVILYL